MVTKIFVSQIDKTNADGTTATEGSYVRLVGGAAVWSSDGVITGDPGYQGSLGFLGSTGEVGFIGSIGEIGLIGPMGDPGFQGSAGDSGNGYNGSLGALGYEGSIGDIGFQGSLGDVGYQGSLGYSGVVGPDGFQGSTGDIGFTGSVGDSGFQGSAGGTAPGTGVPVPFTYVSDLSPNTYTSYANYLVAVNETADGVTLIPRETFIAANTVDNDINFPAYPADTKYINYARIKSYSEKCYSDFNLTPSNNIQLLASLGSIYNITLSPTSGSIVTIQMPTDSEHFYNQHYNVILYLKQGSTASTVDWSLSNVKWPSGSGVPSSGPLLSVTPGSTDVINLSTMDNGTTWYGFFSAKGFGA